VGETNRRTDVIGGTTYYEYKSTSLVPPDKSVKQFTNDLANPNISKLSQIQWRFDSRVHGGFGPAEKQTMMDAIKTANIDNKLANKFSFADKADLLNGIDLKFNSIFQVQ
jgi:hypothetical protein